MPDYRFEYVGGHQLSRPLLLSGQVVLPETSMRAAQRRSDCALLETYLVIFAIGYLHSLSA